MPSSSSSSSSSSIPWSTLAPSLKDSTDSTLSDQEQPTADEYGDSSANAVNSKINAETGSPLSPQAIQDFSDYLSSLALSLTDTAETANDTAFSNYPWSGSTSSSSTTMDLDSGPTANMSVGTPSWNDISKTPAQNWGSFAADITAKGATSTPITVGADAILTVNGNNLTVSVRLDVQATISSSTGSVPIAGGVVITIGRRP